MIALLKAFGYSERSIAVHYVGYAIVASAVGVLVGYGAGVWLGEQLTALYAKFYRFPHLLFHVPGTVLAGSFAIAAIAAMLGAVGAVKTVLRLPPAESMRPAAPKSYQPGMIARMPIFRHVDPMMQMVWRTLERSPWKTVASVGTVVLAVAILVIGRSMFDMFDEIMDVQFNQAQRQDVTLTFFSPRSSQARYDLQSLPGVMTVETFRVVPVDLSSHAGSKRLVLTSMSRDADLVRVVGSNRRPEHIHEEGVTLTDFLAQELDVSVGDTVDVDVLEGRRMHHRIPVVGLTSEMFGVQAYMSPKALSALLQEQGSVSGAYIGLDTEHQDQFSQAVKNLPMVTGTLVRASMLQGFDDNYRENMDISSIYLVVFAVVIALGVVYSNARIAVSERSVELASLRILGFRVREITFILLAEQALMVLFAIPIGVVLGGAVVYALPASFATELLRFPAVISMKNIGISLVTMVGIAGVTALLIGRKLKQLDLIVVLKSRET